MKKYFTVPGLLVLPAVRGCGWCKLIHDLDPTPVGFTWFWLVLKYANESTFTFSGYHTSWPHMTFDIHLWPLTLWTCESFHIISIMYHDSPIALCTSRSRSRINQIWFQLDFLKFSFSNEVNFTFWAHLTTWPLMTFDLGTGCPRSVGHVWGLISPKS